MGGRLVRTGITTLCHWAFGAAGTLFCDEVDSVEQEGTKSITVKSRRACRNRINLDPPDLSTVIGLISLALIQTISGVYASLSIFSFLIYPQTVFRRLIKMIQHLFHRILAG